MVRHGSLLLLHPKLVSFDSGEYADFNTSFHAQFAARPPPGLVAPTFKTVQYHVDRWVLNSANHTLTRLHKRARLLWFLLKVLRTGWLRPRPSNSGHKQGHQKKHQ